MRAVLVAAAILLGACAELGVVSDGTSISVGKASRGYLIDGARLPDKGDGYMTREVWQLRGNRYGTDELIDLISGVARRMSTKVKDVKLVVADLSGKGGTGGSAFHRSHQSGRDVDLVYYMRDAEGNPFEADAMHVFDQFGRARDGSGLRVDVPRTWLLAKELVEGREAVVQYIFMYEPIAQMLIEHAVKSNEPPDVIARVRKALKQPGDSARHDDHMHVRVYCSEDDRFYGCVDYGPMELLAERQAQDADLLALMSGVSTPPQPEPNRSLPVETPVLGATAIQGTLGAATGASALRSMFRTRIDRISLGR